MPVRIFCTLFFAVATTGNSVELNPLFQDNAVLQCDQRVTVWGVARDGEKITVTFAGQKVSTVATNGAWKIWFKPMKPNATPQTLTVAGDLTSIITNVLVGEVWGDSGQSNMERQFGLWPGQQPIAESFDVGGDCAHVGETVAVLNSGFCIGNLHKSRLPTAGNSIAQIMYPSPTSGHAPQGWQGAPLLFPGQLST